MFGSVIGHDRTAQGLPGEEKPRGAGLFEEGLCFGDNGANTYIQIDAAE